MPIEFTCECGKAYKVADEYAGKRTKCTACGQPVVVPTPVATSAEEPTDEDAAFRALIDGDDPDPAPRATRSYAGADDAPRRPAPPPPRQEDAGSHAARTLANSMAATKTSEPKAKKGRPVSYGSSYDHPPERSWSPNWLKVGGGLLSILIGGALLGLRLMTGGFSIWGAGLILIGIFGIINGLLNRS
jgi:hypothetical protein